MDGTPLDPARSLQLYGRRARRYELLHHLQTLWADTSHRRAAIAELKVAPEDRVLDVGTGTGLVAAGVADTHPRLVVGIDRSAEMLSIAQRRGPTSGWVRGDCTSLPFADASFDKVISVYGFGGVAEPGRAMAEISRVLRPDGRLVMLEMTSPPADGGRLRRWLHRHIVAPWVRRHWEFADVAFEPLLGANGLHVENSRHVASRLIGSATIIIARKLP